MNIDEAIKSLQSIKKAGVKNIILAWWEADQFQKQDDQDWEGICDVVDSKMDWSNTHESLQCLIDIIEKNP